MIGENYVRIIQPGTRPKCFAAQNAQRAGPFPWPVPRAEYETRPHPLERYAH